MAQKISKTQAESIQHLKDQIDYARTHDVVHWISKVRGYDLDLDWDTHPNEYLTNEGLLKAAMKMVADDDSRDGRWRKEYEKRKNGIALTHCNSRTLYALEKLGMVDSIYDSKHGGTIDSVKLLNY